MIDVIQRLRGGRGSGRGQWPMILGATLLAVVSGCNGQQTGPQGFSGPGGTMTVAVRQDFFTFDPAGGPGGSHNAYELTGPYASLLALDASGRLIPYLAKSWKVTPTSVTFTLRTDATCADGTRVTPSVVKNSLQRLIDVKSGLANDNWGPGPYSVSEDDAADTVTFSVGSPYSDLVYGFTDDYPATFSSIVCPAGLSDPTAMNTQAFGAGPYTIVEAVHNDHVTMKLRPEFKWGPFDITAQTAGVPQTVIYKVVSNDTTSANLLITGGIDVANIFGPDTARLLADNSLLHRSVPTYTMGIYVFNESAGRPTADMTIRQALSTAIDPKAQMQAATGGGVPGRLSPSIISREAKCFDPGTAQLGPTPSVSNARSLLEAAGWSMENGKLTKSGQILTINFVGDMRMGAGNEYAQSQWTSMGANVLYNITDSTTWGVRLQKGDYDVTMLDPGVTGFDPAVGKFLARYSGPFPPHGGNWFFLSDPVFNSEAKAAEATLGTESCANWAKVQEELLKQWAFVPLYASNLEYFTTKFDLSRVIGASPPPITLLRVKA